MVLGLNSLKSFVNSFKKKICDVYSKEHLEKLAKETGFRKRGNGKLSPQLFFEMLLFKKADSRQISLNDHCAELMFNGVKVSKQSLHERFNQTSVDFVKRLVEEQLQNQITSSIKTEALKGFTSVKIKDSIRYQIPENLKEKYPGSSGGASGAAAHIQFEFDLISGRTTDLHLTGGYRQDTTDAFETVSSVKEGELIIRDLGYFSMDVLEKIQEQQAYFISRLKPKVGIYQLKEKKYVLLDLVALHQELKDKKLAYKELKVYIGNDKKLPVRLVAEALPEDVTEKRLARANKEAKKKGRSLSKDYKVYASLNLFITNVKEEILKTMHVRSLYRLRWQIELRFKTWKSYFNIHKTKKMNCCRFECYLYASLLHILINWEIAINFFEIIWKETDKSLSILKFFKIVVQHTAQLEKAVKEQGKLLDSYLTKLYQTSLEKLLSEKKKGKACLAEILSISIDNQQVI